MPGDIKTSPGTVPTTNVKRSSTSTNTLLVVIMAPLVLLLSLLVPSGFDVLSGKVWATTTARTVPYQAQIIDQKSFNVLATVPPPDQSNATTVRDLRSKLYIDTTC